MTKTATLRAAPDTVQYLRETAYGPQNADDRVVDTIKQRDERLRDFFDVGSGSREDWYTPTSAGLVQVIAL
jgi:hypothetical protein